MRSSIKIFAAFFFLASCTPELQQESFYTGTTSFGTSSIECPNESIDSAKLVLTHFRQLRFDIEGGGDLFFTENHSANWEYWSLIHHQHFLGSWKMKNDTVFVHYYESHEDFQQDPPGIDYKAQYVMVRSNLFEIKNGCRDSLAFVNVGEKSLWEGPPLMAWPVRDDRK